MPCVQAFQMGSLVFQQHVIDALLSYHPLWLQLALSIIAGQSPPTGNDTEHSSLQLEAACNLEA